MKTEIYMVRHGESVANAAGVMLGHVNLGLTELGEKQALLCAEALRNVCFDAIYSSDLIRAYNTARPHAELRGMQIVPIRGLREMYLGAWEGVSVSDVYDSDEFKIGWKQNFGIFTPPCGESAVDLAKRLDRTVSALAHFNPGKTILIVSHAAAIRTLWCRISGLSPEEWCAAWPFPTNASYTKLEYDGKRLVPIEYSCDSHIKSASQG